jgi:NAD(P)H-hydrate epimerase
MSHKILTPEQIRRIESASMSLQQISSETLMEKAGQVFTDWFLSKFPDSEHVVVVCGKGNNGGDGLVVARLLSQKFKTVRVLLVPWENRETPDFRLNLTKLPSRQGIHIQDLTEPDLLKEIPADWIIVDAILGYGTNRPVTGSLKNIIDTINQLPNVIVSIDLPSGMVCYGETKGSMIHADEVLSFEYPKLGFLLPENEPGVSHWDIRSIGLSKAPYEEEKSQFFLTEPQDVSVLLKVRSRFSHKHLHGHALIIAGSKNMCGAGILCASAAIRIGAGLISLMTEPSCFSSLFSYQPEIMALPLDPDANIDFSSFKSIGLGPGLSGEIKMDDWIKKWSGHSLVIDAQAILSFAKHPELIRELPENTVFTPHPGELRQLLGQTGTYLEQLERTQTWAIQNKKYVVVKGAYTAIVMPDGNVFFNQTGNPGMSTAGSGDVLTGILTGLLAQGYDMPAALKMGVWIHGLAGDLALDNQSQESLCAGDLIDHLGLAYQQIQMAK